MQLTLKLARKDGTYDKDPAEVLPSFAVKYEPRTRHLSFAEAEKLLAELPEHRRSVVRFILATACRWGEMERAELSDVRLSAKSSTLVKGQVDVRGTKTAGSKRTLPIVAHSEALLRSVVSDPAIASKGPMFAAWNNARRDLLSACKRAGIDPISANDLRRTCASWLRQAGVEPGVIGSFLGHTDPRMAYKVYGHMGDQLGAVISDALSSKLGAQLVKQGARLALSAIAKPPSKPAKSLPAGKAPKALPAATAA
jgi:integrase